MYPRVEYGMSFARDLRQAVRRLRKSPGYFCACVAILALGIGANIAIFSVIDAVILNALPFRDPARLVFVWERYPNMPDPPGSRIQVARTNYLHWKQQNRVFSGMAAYRGLSWTETGAGDAKRVNVGATTADLFPLLGIQPRLGRSFTADEQQHGRDLVAVLSDNYFEKRFGRDRSCLGRRITLNGADYTVVGVLPPEFHLPATWQGMDQLKPDVWVPLSRTYNSAQDDSQRQLFVAARLKPGVDLARARAEMDAIARRLHVSEAKLDSGWLTSVYRFQIEDTSPSLRRALQALMGAVLFVLLIACANIANLALARGARRTREVAVRLAVGASRSDIVRQILAETLVIGVAGAAVGLLLAYWGIRLLTSFKPEDAQHMDDIHLNAAAFLFAAAAGLISAVLFGMAPAIAAARTDLNESLKAAAGRTGSGRHSGARQVLVSLEVALALVLLSGCALMLRSLYNVLSTDLGYQVDRVAMADIDLPQSRYKDDAAVLRFNRELLSHLQSLPGATAAALSDAVPLHRISVSNVRPEGQPARGPGNQFMSDVAHVTPGFFTALGMRLKLGRLLTDADVPPGADPKGGSLIVNEAFARQYWPGANPIGKHVSTSDDGGGSFTIVGVVSDVLQMGAENSARPEIFFPSAAIRNPTLMVRAARDPHTLVHAITRQVAELDRGLAVDNAVTMDHQLDEFTSQRRFNTLLTSIFAGLALILALAGTYAVLSNLVASRTREWGIRSALGATPRAVRRLALLQALRPVAVGAAAGVCGAWLLGRYVESLLFGVTAHDPAVLSAAVIAILAAAALASWIPACRAGRVDPNIALREE